MEIMVRVTGISAERLVDPHADLPKDLRITVNVNVQRFPKNGDVRTSTFVMDVSYVPPIARVIVRGNVYVRGGKPELKKLDGNTPPAEVMQTVTTVALTEVFIVCRSIGVPPPIPPLVPSKQEGKVEDLDYSA